MRIAPLRACHPERLRGILSGMVFLPRRREVVWKKIFKLQRTQSAQRKMEENLKSGQFRIFYCLAWTILKIIPAFALIYFWDYGIYVVVAYILYVLEDMSFLQFRMTGEANKCFNDMENKISAAVKN